MMNEYKIVGMGPVSLHSVEPPHQFDDMLDQIIKEKIESAWNEAVLKSNGKLFDGHMFNCVNTKLSNNQVHVIGYFIPYRYFWAQRNIPDLNLNITPVGVSGIMVTQDQNTEYVTFALRSNTNLQYKGYYELVPSGSINNEEDSGKIDYFKQLLIELEEEVGITKASIEMVSALGLILDTKDNVYDIGCLLKVNTGKDELEKLIKCSGEYTAVEFVSMDKLSVFLKTKSENLVPVSVGLVEMYNLTKNNY